MEALLEDCRRIVDDIGPENGSLDGIGTFMANFAKLLNLIKPTTAGAGNHGWILEQASNLHADSASWKVDGTGDALADVWESLAADVWSQTYGQLLPINKMIYGNMALAAYWDDAYPDYVPPTCFEMGTDETQYTLTERIHNWFACMSDAYINDLLDWCMENTTEPGAHIPGYTDEGWDEHMLESGMEHEEHYPGYWAWRQAILAAAFIKKFEDEINTYAPDLFYNTDSVEKELSAPPFNLDEQYPTDGRADFDFSSFGGPVTEIKSWAKLIRNGLWWISHWGCDPDISQPFKQAQEVVSLDTEGWYIWAMSEGGSSPRVFVAGADYPTGDTLSLLLGDDEFMRWYIWLMESYQDDWTAADTAAMLGEYYPTPVGADGELTVSEECFACWLEFFEDFWNMSADWRMDIGVVFSYEQVSGTTECIPYIQWGEDIGIPGPGEGIIHSSISNCYYLRNGPMTGAHFKDRTASFYVDGAKCAPVV